MDDKPRPCDFVRYLQSTVKMKEIERITRILDRDQADSQRIFNLDVSNLNRTAPNTSGEHSSNHLSHEQIPQFLADDAPNLLLPDMEIISVNDININGVMADMKKYLENLKNNLIDTTFQPESEPINVPVNIIQAEVLEQYISSLYQLKRSLTNLKRSNKEDQKIIELEVKLIQLWKDLNMFTQMVQSKTALRECNRNWTHEKRDSSALFYSRVINDLLKDINEVTLLMKK